jgi:hypothetical protein
MMKTTPKSRLVTLALFLGLMIGCDGGELVFVTPDPDTYVVQAFLYSDEPVQGVTVTGVLPIDADSTEVPPPVTGARLTIVRGTNRYDLVDTPGEPGRYHYPKNGLQIHPGDVLDLEVSVRGNDATARTVVPTPPVGLELADDHLATIDPYSGGGRPNATLTVRWSNPGYDLHFLVVDHLEADPTLLPTAELASLLGTPRFVTQPTAADSTFVQQLSLTYYGRHRVKLYRVNDEYAALYEGLQQDSRDLNQPPTNINGALGVFSAFAADSAFFEVR